MLKKHSYPNVCSWWDFSEPTTKELAALSKEVKMNVADIHYLIDKDSRSKTEDVDNFSLIVFRAPVSEETRLVTAPIAIFFNKNKVITIRNKKIDGVERLTGLKIPQKNKILKKGGSNLVYRLLDSLLESFFVELEDIEERIEKTEKSILSKSGKGVMNKLFSVKKRLIFFHRALIANREVISAIEKEYVPHIGADDLKHYRELYDDCVQLIDLEETYREILVSLIDINLSVESHNTSKIMKTLTVIAAFVWIPTLIAGVYGMNFFAANTQYAMPEIYWVYGYPFAIALMIVSTLTAALIFKKKGWF